jgi:hypothetical protein
MLPRDLESLAQTWHRGSVDGAIRMDGVPRGWGETLRTCRATGSIHTFEGYEKSRRGCAQRHARARLSLASQSPARAILLTQCRTALPH